MSVICNNNEGGDCWGDSFCSSYSTRRKTGEIFCTRTCDHENWKCSTCNLLICGCCYFNKCPKCGNKPDEITTTSGLRLNRTGSEASSKGSEASNDEPECTWCGGIITDHDLTKCDSCQKIFCKICVHVNVKNNYASCINSMFLCPNCL